ncbi:hypothetical protein GCM10022631_16850 [Deinococcus rubellus]|uniref:Uncharacterized protein n=1 Tax=Deinococcus rubellus TaxID=1889240 RepID=A0ABY5YHK6_9DEIO|nr:hypothetical protein [Deinococcus rubellus]UWX64578.1 hypothetical protein N0D28_02625 [Deinococcus rubellus]
MSASDRPSILRGGALLLSLSLLGSAGAQNLDAYRQLKVALGNAVQDRAFSKARSLGDLQKAQQALDTLKPTIRSDLLAQGLDASLSSSRASLARSAADLEAQVTQARGLMRAVLYSQTLSALAAAQSAAPPAGQSASLQNQSRLLAEEFGLDAASRSLFLKSVSRDAAQAQRLLDQAAARKVQGYLGAVNLADRAGAYLNLTRAASWFTAAQGAPAAGNLQVDQFASAFSALGGGDSGAARSALQALRAGAARFVIGASAAPGSASAVLPPSQATSQGTPGSTIPSQTAPAASPTPVGQPIATAPLSGSGEAGVDQVYANLGRALSAAAVADQPAARQALADAERALGQASTLSRSVSYPVLAQDLSTLKTRSGLRPGDVQSLIGELGNVEAEASAKPGSVLNASAASVSRSFGGGVRAIFFFVLALLSAYPLYLLNLAFGSRNPYWRAILGGLILLLLPALLEGVGGLLGFLGDLSGVGALRSLTNLTLTQNAWGGPVWILSLLLALTALTYGFRGLCLQFGLLGANARPLQTETQSSLEWDEEI